MDQSLDDVLPPTKEVRVNADKVVSVGPLPFGRVPQALKLARPFAGLIVASLAAAKGDDSVGDIDLVNLMTTGGDSIMEFIVLATKDDLITRKWLDNDCPMDVGVALMEAVVLVNRDFFIQKVRPMLVAAIGNLKAAAKKETGSS